MATPETWLILPTYNEAENIAPFVEAVQAELPPGARVLIVDDSSPDGTGEIADRLAAEREGVAVLHRPLREGLGPAYIAGFREALAAGAELILEMDSDFSHEPAYLPRLLEAAEGADLVIGSRYVDGGGVGDWGAMRRAISRGGSAYARLVLGVAGRRPDRRLQMLPARGAGGDRPRRGAVEGLRLPGRAHLPGACSADSGSSRCRSSSATAGSEPRR